MSDRLDEIFNTLEILVNGSNPTDYIMGDEPKMKQRYDAFIEAKQALQSYIDTKIIEARKDVRNEVRAKIEALDKLIMGAGEYHDDPYEYVVPLRHIKEYRAALSKFDLDNPVYKEVLNHRKDENGDSK